MCRSTVACWPSALKTALPGRDVIGPTDDRLDSASAGLQGICRASSVGSRPQGGFAWCEYWYDAQCAAAAPLRSRAVHVVGHAGHRLICQGRQAWRGSRGDGGAKESQGAVVMVKMWSVVKVEAWRLRERRATPGAVLEHTCMPPLSHVSMSNLHVPTRRAWRQVVEDGQRGGRARKFEETDPAAWSAGVAQSTHQRSTL